jgi:hypothetical protein
MLDSFEFGDVVKLTFEQLDSLGFDPMCCDVTLVGGEGACSERWVYTGQVDNPVNKTNTPVNDPAAVALSEPGNTDYRVIAKAESGEVSAREQPYIHIVTSGNASLRYYDEAERLSDLQVATLARITTVVAQAFVRCADLRNIEIQTRQARVESALERLRVRTMAMNQSEELADAAGLLYSELSKLGILIISCGYVLIDTSTKTGSHYLATPEGSFELKPFHLKHTESETLLNIYTSWETREPYSVTVLKGKDNLAHHALVASKAVNFPWPEKQYLALIPEDAVINTINFSRGYLMVLGLEPYEPSQLELLVRFC